MYKKHILSNGLTIVGEEIPHVNSTTFGLWINIGSRIESCETNGISHFIEHMVFKGTKNRTAKEIAEEIDNLGGQINAFTSKDSTCFYVKMLDEHIDIGVDIISDMILNPLFSVEDTEKERSVILEEIKMYEDSPEDLVNDILFEYIYNNEGLGMNILGTEESLKNINADKLKSFFAKYYTPKNSVISVCGNFDFSEICQLIERKFALWNNDDFIDINISKDEFKAGEIKRNKDIEQINLSIGLKTIPIESDDIYVLTLVNNVFGGSMSSRLFQNVREELGKAYSIYSYPTLNKNNGVLNIFASMSNENFQDVYDAILVEIKKFKEQYLTLEEINKAKEQFKGNYIIGLESTSSRMMSMGKSELLFKRIRTPKDIINKINEITYEDVKKVIDQTFNIDNMAIAIVGKEVENFIL